MVVLSQKALCTVPDFSRMSMKADPGMEELVNPMCPLLWQLRRLSWGLLSGSDVSSPINSRLGNSQAQTRKSASFLEPFQSAKNGRKGKEAEGNPGNVQDSSKLQLKERCNHCRQHSIPSMDITARSTPGRCHRASPREGSVGFPTFLLSLKCLFQFNTAWRLSMLAEGSVCPASRPWQVISLVCSASSFIERLI